MQQTPEQIRDRMRDLQQAGNVEEAIAICSAAMVGSSEEERHRLLDYRASAKWRAGHRQEAMADMEAAIAAAPHWAGHLYQYMLWCIDLELFEDAAKTSRRLMDVESARNSAAFLDSARFFQAYALGQLGRWKEALAAAKRVQDEKQIWVAGRLVSISQVTDAAAAERKL